MEKKKQIQVSKNVHMLQVALGMSGLAADFMACETIIETQKAITKMGNDFDLMTAAKIRAKMHKKYNP